jgi:hypothetical protein
VDTCRRATRLIEVPREDLFAVLADPTTHAAIDGTGSVGEPLDTEVLGAVGQLFRMEMHHPRHPNGTYLMTNRVQESAPPAVISWEPGYDPGDGSVRFEGWIWRYDLTELGPSTTEVTLTYDWTAVPDPGQLEVDFPPFGPEHLSNSLEHLAELAAS